VDYIFIALLRKAAQAMSKLNGWLSSRIATHRRGQRDYFASHDLEDFIAVIDGRPSLSQEIQEASPELRAFLGEAVRSLLGASRFLDALPGYLSPDAANQARIVSLSGKLDALSRIV
jgi:hypothetical protein